MRFFATDAARNTSVKVPYCGTMGSTRVYVPATRPYCGPPGSNSGRCLGPADIGTAIDRYACTVAGTMGNIITGRGRHLHLH